VRAARATGAGASARDAPYIVGMRRPRLESTSPDATPAAMCAVARSSRRVDLPMYDDECATCGAPPPGVHYFPRAFDDTFLERIDAAREAAPVSLASQNMAAERRFIRDAKLAEDISRAFVEPARARVDVVCSDIRFIDYDAGGFILPHVDGARVCEATGVTTDASVLVFLTTVPPGEGGETEFLVDVNSGDEDGCCLACVRREGRW
jgi:hypothetical protein